ncbi:TIGR00725 family protein [Thermosipho ferrireducens]|uniref:TIGR00725 family protein n=1 Tax=Thermosipho ferrireducens TaxID=2571116 RepID=A0ABX7S7U8_9BACT|nr:TIGR00725 family protein [Thermosipho ferrireducens]QTA38667.1 TIGR00725 family protein [Thermosipho ferrireducens]
MKRVAVIGYSGNPHLFSLSLKELCIEIGKELGKKYIVYTGGRDGVMELVSKGVKEVGGVSLGILPFEEDGNKYVTHQIQTGLDFQMRSFILVKNVDVVVSIGGEIGTAIEILGAYSNRKPVILMSGTGGWTDRIQKVLIEGKYLDNRKLAVVYKATSILEMLKILEKTIGE